MRGAIKTALKTAKAHAIRFEATKTPVLIFGLRRGGTTMVADAVAANEGVFFINEPYAALPRHPAYAIRRAELPEAWHSHFFELNPADLDRFSAYTDKLLTAHWREMGTARNAGFPPRADRICLKILNAPWMAPWFAREIEGHKMVLLRHPGGQVSSVLRQNWGFPLEAYISRPEALAAHFAPDEIAYLQEGFASNDRWRMGVLDWVVQAVPLLKMERMGVPLFRYEDVVLDPIEFVDGTLRNSFGLEDRDAMIEAFGKPSGSSRMSKGDTLSLIQSGDRNAVIERWRRDVTEDECRTGQEILERFGIDLYRF